MDPQGSALRESLHVLWRRKWWIVIPTIVGVAVALAISMRQTPTYVSSAELLVLPVRDPSSLGPAPIQIENELRVAQSVAVREVAQELLTIDGQTLAPVLIENPPETQTLVFESRSPVPRLAQASADAYAQAYLDFRAESQLQTVETAAAALEEVIAGLNEDLALAREALENANTSSQTEAIQFRIGTLQTELSQQQATLNELELLRTTRVGEVLAPAFLPDAPSSPSHVRAGVLGGVVGILVGLGLAFLRERLDPRVRGRDDLEQAAEVPLLATIPHVRRPIRTGLSGPRSDPRVGEAFRALRARILFASSQRPLRSLLITSPTQGEGKTTTAASLGITLAEGGKRVTLVDADLHNRTLNAYFPVQDGVGLTEVLEDPDLLGQARRPTAVDDLFVISASPSGLPPPTGGFSASALHEILERLSGVSDLVIFDSTPVLSLSDALELAPIVDGVLLVVDVGKASWGEVEESALQLGSVGAQMLGVVAMKVVPGRFLGYHHVRYEDYQRLVPTPPRGAGTDDGEVEREPAAPRDRGELPHERARPRDDGDAAEMTGSR